MYYESIHLRCKNGIEYPKQGVLDPREGFKFYSCSKELCDSSVVDQNLLSSVPAKISHDEKKGFMDDAYFLRVPDFGNKIMHEFHPIPFDLDDVGDFSKRRNWMHHMYVGPYESFYPFEIFADDRIWYAKLKKESFYYSVKAENMPGVDIKPSGSFDEKFNKIGEFVAAGRKTALQKTVAFLIKQYSLPADQRQYLIIKDETTEDILNWIAAIELAFSPRIASNVSFASRQDTRPSENMYYVGDDLKLTADKRHARLKAMVIGAIRIDSENFNVRIYDGAPYVVLDGTKKEANFEVDTDAHYFNLITSYSDKHKRFVTEFLQSLDVRVPSADLFKLAEAYEVIEGSTGFNIDLAKYSKAMAIMSANPFADTTYLRNMYADVNGKLSSYVKANLGDALPIMNWVGKAATVLGDADAKKKVDEIITDRAVEVFFSDYKKGGIQEFWDRIAGGPFEEQVAAVLQDKKILAEYAQTVKTYSPTDAELFSKIYAKVCADVLAKDGDAAKKYIAYAMNACISHKGTDSIQNIINALRKIKKNDTYEFILSAMCSADVDNVSGVANFVLRNDPPLKNDADAMLDFCNAMHKCKMDSSIFSVMKAMISTGEEKALYALTNKINAQPIFSAEAKKGIFEAIDACLDLRAKSSSPFAKLLQEKKPRTAACTNSASVLLLEAVQNMRRGRGLEEEISEYVHQGAPGPAPAEFVSDLVNTLIDMKLSKEDQDYVLDMLIGAPEAYFTYYLDVLIANAHDFAKKWAYTIGYVAEHPDKKLKAQLKNELINCLRKSELKKRQLEGLGRLISDDVAGAFYDSAADVVIDEMGDEGGSVFSKLFGRKK